MSIKALVTIGLRSSLIIFDISCSYGRGGGIRSAPFGAITPPRLEFRGGLPSSRFCLPAPFPYLKQSLPSSRVGANCTLYSLLIPPFEIPPPDKKTDTQMGALFFWRRRWDSLRAFRRYHAASLAFIRHWRRQARVRIHPMPKKESTFGALFFWRRRWDSNPRYLSGYTRFRVEAVITTSILLHILSPH